MPQEHIAARLARYYGIGEIKAMLHQEFLWASFEFYWLR
jgi:hypothetical protein